MKFFKHSLATPQNTVIPIDPQNTVIPIDPQNTVIPTGAQRSGGTPAFCPSRHGISRLGARLLQSSRMTPIYANLSFGLAGGFSPLNRTAHKKSSAPGLPTPPQTRHPERSAQRAVEGPRETWSRQRASDIFDHPVRCLCF